MNQRTPLTVLGFSMEVSDKTILSFNLHKAIETLDANHRMKPAATTRLSSVVSWDIHLTEIRNIINCLTSGYIMPQISHQFHLHSNSSSNPVPIPTPIHNSSLVYQNDSLQLPPP